MQLFDRLIVQPGRLQTTLTALLFGCLVAFMFWRTSAKMIDVTDPHGSELSGSNGMADFRDVIYFPTRAVADGVNPYDSALEPLADGSLRYRQRYPVHNLFPLYSPMVLLLFGVFSIPEFYPAAYGFLVLNVLLLVAWSYAIWKFTGQTPTIAGVLWLGSAMLVTQAGRAIFIGGETAIPLTLATFLAIFLSRQNARWAGLALAITSFKPTFGLPLGLLMLIRREWSAVAIGWGAGFVIAVAGLLYIFGQAGDLGQMRQIILHNQEVLEQDPDTLSLFSLKRVDAVAVIERWLGVTSPIGRFAVFALVLVIVGQILWRLAPHRDDPEAELLLNLATLIGTIALMYRFTYDGLAMWGGIGLLWLTPVRFWRRTSLALRLALGLTLLFPQINFMQTEAFQQWILGLHWEAYAPAAVANFGWTAICTLNGVSLLVFLVILNWHSRNWGIASKTTAKAKC